MSNNKEWSENVNEEAANITESHDVSQQFCENNESQREEPSNDENSSVIETLSHGWIKISKKRLTGKTAGRYDVYFESPEGTKIRSKIALVKYISANHVDLKLEEFDFSRPSQLRRRGTRIERNNEENGDRATTLSGVAEEHRAPPVDHAEDTQNTEEDVFIVDDNDRYMTPMKSVGRKTPRGRRRPSERSMKDVTRNKRPRKSSSTKPETQTKKRKYERKIVPKKPKKGASTEKVTLSKSQLQNLHQQIDCNQADDPPDFWDPVLVAEDTEDRTSIPPLELPPGTENENTGSNSSDGDSLTSSGKTNDSIARSQVEKRKTSQYFSKKATRDVQTPCWCSVKENDIRQLQQRHQLNFLRPFFGLRRMESNFDEEKQDLSHVADDEEEEEAVDNETEAANNSSQLCPLTPEVCDTTNFAIAVETSQEAKSDGAGSSTSHPSGRPRPLVCCPTSQGCCCGGENQLLGALSTFVEQRQSEQSPMYHFAVSLVPLLENVPEDRVVAVRHDMLRLITTYLASDALPNQSYPYNRQSYYRQTYSPPPRYSFHASPEPPAHRNLPNQSTSYVQVPPRSNTPLTPASGSRPRSYSLFEAQSSLPIQTGQTKPTSCILF